MSSTPEVATLERGREAYDRRAWSEAFELLTHADNGESPRCGTVGVEDGRPVLEDGTMLGVANVVWCTGFGNEFD